MKEKKIRKLIDIPEGDVKNINRAAIEKNTVFKLYVEDLIIKQSKKVAKKVLVIFALLFLLSCSTQKYGCSATKNFIGYGK